MHYPGFIDDTQYLQMDQALPEDVQLKAMLNNLTRIHLLSARKFDCFDSLIHEYLLSGIEIFGLETGIVSKIQNGNEYTICDVISPLANLEKDMVFPLQDTYCSHVYHENTVIGFPNVGALDFMRNHPVYQSLKLEAYLSAPITVDERLFGTLNFTSIQKRDFGFSEHERNLILLMANSIGAYVSLRKKENALLLLNEKMKKFVGYVAHDLRNPIGSILSICQLADREGLNLERLRKLTGKIAPAAEEALELVTTILDNAALGTGKLELHVATESIAALCEKSVDSVEELAAQNLRTIKCQYPQKASIRVDTKRLHQAINNLLINAIKFSPVNSDIVFRVHQDTLSTTFSITNDIDTQRIQQSSDSRTAGSIGLGLEIVNEILAAHKSTLITRQTETQFEVSFSLLDILDETP